MKAVKGRKSHRHAPGNARLSETIKRFIKEESSLSTKITAEGLASVKNIVKQTFRRKRPRYTIIFENSSESNEEGDEDTTKA
jgi:hypothetical protein